MVKDVLGREFPGASARRRRGDEVVSAEDPLADVAQERERDEVETHAMQFQNPRLARGNLRHKAFPEVLSQLSRWKESGALMLRHERTKKMIYFKDGTPIFVKSNLLSECLGRILVREKMISEQECETSLAKLEEAKAKGEARQQGTVLIEMGCISPHNLVYGLQLQLEAKLFEIFGWRDGEFQFNPKIEIPAQEIHLEMSLSTMIYEGVRRKFRTQQIKDLLTPFDDAVLMVHDDPLYRFRDIALEADERALVAKIDGRRTLNELVAMNLVDEKRARQLIYALLSAEMIQPKVGGQGARKKPPRPPSATPPPLKRKKASPVVGDVARGELSPQTLANLDVPQLRKRLSGRMKTIRKQNAFEILGVSRSASSQEIKRAYLALAKELHPDHLPRNAPSDAKALAEQIQHQLSTAFEALSDKSGREQYAESLTVTPKSGGDEVGRILTAEGAFRQGEQALARSAFADAAESFQKAVALYPDEGEFHAHLGWAKFNAAQTDEDKRAAEDDLLRGVAQSPRRYLCHLFLARVLRALGREAEAVERFESALVCNPDSTEAAEALSLIRKSQRKASPSS